MLALFPPQPSYTELILAAVSWRFYTPQDITCIGNGFDRIYLDFCQM